MIERCTITSRACWISRLSKVILPGSRPCARISGQRRGLQSRSSPVWLAPNLKKRPRSISKPKCHGLFWHGHHATFSRHSECSANREPAASTRKYRQTWRRRRTGARTPELSGDRTVGITEKPGKEFLDQLQQVFGFNPPREHGHDVVHALDAMMRGEAKAFIGLGGNFVAAAPDTPLIYDAFRKLNLTVSVATKLNRTHLPHGRNSFVLPCLARSEIDRTPSGAVQAVTLEDAMSMVQASRGVVAPASPELRSEPWIVASMAR